MSLKCLILAAVVIAVQCSVIKIQQIPISDDLLMKIVVKEGSSDHSRKIASIKIDLEKMESDQEPPRYTRDNSEPPIKLLRPPGAEEEIIPLQNHPRLISKTPTRPKVSQDLLSISDLDKIIAESKIFSIPTSTPKTTETESTKTAPEFDNRFGIGSQVCAEGKVRRGPFCISMGK